MSTRKSRQLGSNYISANIQNFIYDSDEENPKGLVEEEDKTKESRNKGVLKAGVIRDEDGSDNVKIVDFPEIDHHERERLIQLYGGKRHSSGSRLNNSASKQEKKSIFVLGNNYNSEENKIPVELREDTSEDKEIQKAEELSENKSSLFYTIKRRTSGNTLQVGYPKKFKLEIDKDMSDAPTFRQLKIELELEKQRGNEPIRRRNINAIIEELDQIGRNWKESQSKCITPFRWGQPIIKNCNDKWDSHYFTEDIVKVYQKRFEERYCPCPMVEIDYDRCDSQSKIVESGSVCSDSEAVVVGSLALDYEQRRNFSSMSNSIGDDLNSFNTDGQESMILRSGNQGRNRHDERSSNEAGMIDHLSKKSPKSFNRGNKDLKKQINSNRQLVAEMDGYHDHRQYQNEPLDSNKNFEDIKINYDAYGGSSQMDASKSHYEENTAEGSAGMNEENQVACPICERKFEKHVIETHAIQCATATFKD